MRTQMCKLLVVSVFAMISSAPASAQADEIAISRADYQEKLQGFWLGQTIANWTGIENSQVTEQSRISGRH